MNFTINRCSAFCLLLSFSFFSPLSWSLVEGKSGTEEIRIPLKLRLENLDTSKPISMVSIPDHSNRSLLVLQGGKVLMLTEDFEPHKVEIFLELSGEAMIDNAFEEGLLGLVFHPNFIDNHLFYLYHTLQNPKRSVLVERKVQNLEKMIVDPKFSRTILEIPQPYWNHNSGVPEFGPDGYLYLSTGDGGNGNDPHNFSQNTFSLLGKILRLDVNSREGNLEYAIPEDNPYKGKPGYRQEIWALGMRNPWRLHWDFKNNLLFCADVGQHMKEEINLIRKGGNYGWSFREGAESFLLKNLPVREDLIFEDPIFEYDHTKGTSVSGGLVYRGSELSTIDQHYIFGDWGTGKCWAIRVEDGEVSSAKDIKFMINGEVINELPKFVNGKPKSPFKPVNFCLSPKGKLVILDWNGKIYFAG